MKDKDESKQGRSLSDDFVNKIRSIHKDIDPYVLLSMIKESIRNKIKKEKFNEKTLEFLLSVEIKEDLDFHIQKYLHSKKIKNLGYKQDTPKEDAIKEMIDKYREIPCMSDLEKDVLSEIDTPVSVGGLTLLHKAVEEGNLEEVKRLVIAGANIFALDTYNMTPLSRAMLYNHKDIVSYLKHYSK